MDKKIMVDIRQEEAKDFPAVYEVNYNAFKRKDEARLVDRLRLSQAFIPELSLVATIEGKVVGHILFTKIHIVSEDREEISLALAPIAVEPSFQKQGIGNSLIRHGLDKASKLGYKSAIVLGHAEYYPKYGFVPTTKWNIKAPFNVPENTFMGIELVEGALSKIQGTVKYAEEFQAI